MAGYKTLIFNIIALGLLAAKMFWPEADLPSQEEVFTHLDALIAAAIAVVNLALRFVTKTPVMNK